MYDEINDRYGYPLPFEELLKIFHDKLDDEDKREIVTNSFSRENDSNSFFIKLKIQINSIKS